MGDTMVVGGSALTVRPVALDDVDRLVRLFARLSPESVLFRFLAPIPRMRREDLARLVDVDHDRREALVALAGPEIVAVARYGGRRGSSESEIAVTVDDAWQGRGVGPQLACRLAAIARVRGYDTFVATMLPENHVALTLVHRLSPRATLRCTKGEVEARIPLDEVDPLSVLRSTYGPKPRRRLRRRGERPTAPADIVLDAHASREAGRADDVQRAFDGRGDLTGVVSAAARE
jgi:GNAT superfamily N-acetyltransferase